MNHAQMGSLLLFYSHYKNWDFDYKQRGFHRSYGWLQLCSLGIWCIVGLMRGDIAECDWMWGSQNGRKCSDWVGTIWKIAGGIRWTWLDVIGWLGEFLGHFPSWSASRVFCTISTCQVNIMNIVKHGYQWWPGSILKTEWDAAGCSRCYPLPN